MFWLLLCEVSIIKVTEAVQSRVSLSVQNSKIRGFDLCYLLVYMYITCTVFSL